LILIDTSVLIDFIRGHNNSKVEIFKRVLNQKLPYGISAYTYLEILQGAKDGAKYDKLKEYLSTQKIYLLPNVIETFEKAAKTFYELRRKGVTIRSTIDVLIALTAIEHDLFLLHNDRDFDLMQPYVKNLRMFDASTTLFLRA